MDRFEAMSVLLRVVDKGSFSAASVDLRMPLATVSRKVSELEAHLGSKLLVRTTRKLALTDAGSAYVESARRIIEDLGDAERIAAGEFQTPQGELILTAPVLFGRLYILPVVTEFLAAYPDINIRLLLTDRNIHLVDDQVDMAVRIGPLPDSSMVATRVGAMRYVVCANPKLLARHGTPKSPKELTSLPCVSFDFLSQTSLWRFRAKSKKGSIDVPISPRLAVSTAEAAVEAASQGVGITKVLHYQCAEAVREKSLRIILTEFEAEPLPVHLIHAGRGTLPQKMRLFLDAATLRLRDRLKAL